MCKPPFFALEPETHRRPAPPKKTYRKEMRESFSTQPKSSRAFHEGVAVLSRRPVILVIPRRSLPTVTTA